ncbi:MAG TPA: hypothetical protein VGF84_01370 [Micromonosporaceae bacterium]|jgi:hypothetical protein
MSNQPAVRYAITAFGLAIGVLAGCGASAPQPPAVDATARAQLRQDVHAVAKALAAHHRARARAALAALDAYADRAHATGRLDDAKFAQIQSAATTLAADLRRGTDRPAPTVTVTTGAPAPPGHGPKPPGHGGVPPGHGPKPPKPGHGPKGPGGDDEGGDDGG